jgi:hypothetical protein
VNESGLTNGAGDGGGGIILDCSDMAISIRVG